MANFFYYGADGRKQGPITHAALESLVRQGVISPQTQLETDTGHRGQAGQIPGLFAASTTNPPFGPVPIPQTAATGFWTTLTTKSVTLSQSKQKSKILWWICLGCFILTLFAAVVALPGMLNGTPDFVVLIIPPAGALLIFFFWAFFESSNQLSACPSCERLHGSQMIREETLGKTKKVETRTKEASRIKHSSGGRDTVITRQYEAPVTVHQIKRYFQCKFCQHNWTDITSRTTDGWEN